MKFLKILLKIYLGIWGTAAMLCVCWCIPLFLFGSSERNWGLIGIFFLIAVIGFGQMWLKEKIRRKMLSPDERLAEDVEKKKHEKMLERARYYSGQYSHNNWKLTAINKKSQRTTNK